MASLVVQTHATIRRPAFPKLPPQYPTFQTAVEHVRHLFESAVALRLRADVRVGTSLSGGLDSSSIAVQMHQQLQNQGVADHQESVSAVFPQKKYGSIEKTLLILQ